ncbi:MAG: DUF5682 family protein, partial [Ilumatobacteraceae bacterium]
MTARIRLLGIRHHGPGSARAVLAALRADPPDVVLLEAPADADTVLALAADPEMQPPVALLGYVVDRPERAAFYPFASFSPEWAALTWALEAGVPVRCIDIPVRHSLAPQPAEQQLTLTDAPPRPADPLAELALAAGYDDAERWWEDVVEHRDADAHAGGGGGDPDGPFPAIGEAMGALRSLYEPDGVPPDP